MSGAHTTGPWAAIRSHNQDNTGGRDFAIVSPQKHIIAEAFQHVAHDGAGGYVVAPVDANARLIAAAPELLEAVEAFIATDPSFSRTCLSRLEAMSAESELARVVLKCRTALAKAKGKA